MTFEEQFRNRAKGFTTLTFMWAGTIQYLTYYLDKMTTCGGNGAPFVTVPDDKPDICVFIPMSHMMKGNNCLTRLPHVVL